MIGKITTAHHQAKTAVSYLDKKTSTIFDRHTTIFATISALANIYLYGGDTSLSTAFQEWGAAMGFSMTVIIFGLQLYGYKIKQREDGTVPTHTTINKWASAIGIFIGAIMVAVYFG